MNKNKACLSARQGFTLIELIIYITVFAVIVVVFTLFVFNFINTYAKIRITKEVSESSQIAMEIMLLEIRHAEDIYISNSSFDSHPGKLSLKTEGGYIDFYLNENNQLYIEKEGQEAEPITPESIKVNSLIFNYLTVNDTESIRIELLSNYGQESNKITHQATTTIISSANLRND